MLDYRPVVLLRGDHKLEIHLWKPPAGLGTQCQNGHW